MTELRQPFNQILKLYFALKFHRHFKWCFRKITENSAGVNPHLLYLLNEIFQMRN